MILIYVIVAVWLAVWLAPRIGRWLLHRGMRRMQNNMYRQMGLDPREVERQQREARRAQKQAERRAQSRQARQRRGRIIPAEYGDEVQYQVLNITGTEIWLTHTADSPVYRTYRTETQISEAKYTIIS